MVLRLFMSCQEVPILSAAQHPLLKHSGKNIEKMIIQETAGLKIAFGENPKRIHSHGNKRFNYTYGNYGNTS